MTIKTQAISTSNVWNNSTFGQTAVTLRQFQCRKKNIFSKNAYKLTTNKTQNQVLKIIVLSSKSINTLRRKRPLLHFFNLCCYAKLMRYELYVISVTWFHGLEKYNLHFTVIYITSWCRWLRVRSITISL